jgi:uncharacterized membrane protein YbhN (UPF0104 family)
MLAALGISLLKLALQALAFVAVLSAYDFGFSFWVKMTVFLVTYIGISVPSTPASLGVFQLFCTTGLMHFGIAKPVAGGFALVAYGAVSHRRPYCHCAKRSNAAATEE